MSVMDYSTHAGATLATFANSYMCTGQQHQAQTPNNSHGVIPPQVVGVAEHKGVLGAGVLAGLLLLLVLLLLLLAPAAAAAAACCVNMHLASTTVPAAVTACVLTRVLLT